MVKETPKKAKFWCKNKSNQLLRFQKILKPLLRSVGNYLGRLVGKSVILICRFQVFHDISSM